MGRRGRVPPPDPSKEREVIEVRYLRASPEDVDAWCPAYNLLTDTLEQVPEGMPRSAGYFRASLMRFGPVYRVSCWGADDTGMERNDLSQRTARNLWSQINHHTTKRTLRRLGFVPA